MPHRSNSIRQSFDRFGIAMAGLCALHCLSTIVLVWIMGVGGHFLLAPDIHRVGLVLAIIAAVLAIGWGTFRHRRSEPFAISFAGLVSMGMALVVPHGSGEAMLTLIGVALVTIGHLLNIRAVR